MIGDARRPGDEQALTVQVDDDRFPQRTPTRSSSNPAGSRIAGRDRMEPVAGGTGPPWPYVYVDQRIGLGCVATDVGEAHPP